MVEGGKLHLIVETSAKMSPHYKALIGKIREALEKDSLTKEEALSMRARLLKQYGGRPPEPSHLCEALGSLEKATAKCEAGAVNESLEKDKKLKSRAYRHPDGIGDWAGAEEEESLEKDKNQLWWWTGSTPFGLAKGFLLRTWQAWKSCARLPMTILSYVGSRKRHLQQTCGMEVCWRKLGRDGKCHLACGWGAGAIFGDCASVIGECREWGLDTYAINGCGYETFAEAVEAYLKNL
eukprot:s2064_g10.t1